MSETKSRIRRVRGHADRERNQPYCGHEFLILPLGGGAGRKRLGLGGKGGLGAWVSLSLG